MGEDQGKLSQDGARLEDGRLGGQDAETHADIHSSGRQRPQRAPRSRDAGLLTSVPVLAAFRLARKQGRRLAGG